MGGVYCRPLLVCYIVNGTKTRKTKNGLDV